MEMHSQECWLPADNGACVAAMTLKSQKTRPKFFQDFQSSNQHGTVVKSPFKKKRAFYGHGFRSGGIIVCVYIYIERIIYIYIIIVIYTYIYMYIYIQTHTHRHVHMSFYGWVYSWIREDDLSSAFFFLVVDHIPWSRRLGLGILPPQEIVHGFQIGILNNCFTQSPDIGWLRRRHWYYKWPMNINCGILWVI